MIYLAGQKRDEKKTNTEECYGQPTDIWKQVLQGEHQHSQEYILSTR